MSLILKLLGFLDLAAAAALFTASGPLLPVKWVLTLAVGLAVKGVMFNKDPVSVFDVILGLYLALTLAFNIHLLSVLFGIYLAIKGLYSFL